MKLSSYSVVLVVVAADSASAFRAAFVGRPMSRLALSAVLEEASSTSTTNNDDKPVVRPRLPTRFDHFKTIYKGPRFQQLFDDRVQQQEIPFSYSEFDLAVNQTEYFFRRDAVVTGTVVEYSGDTGCLVDIGAKASAFLPAKEAALGMDYMDKSQKSAQLADLVPLDTPMEFQIISEEDENGQLLVSVKRLQFKLAWEKILAQAAQDEVLQAPVVAVNRGGVICLVHGLRAFLPGSHLAGQLPDEALIGQTLPLKFLEVNQETNKLVVSNRKAVVEQQMAGLSRGDLVQGVVKALKPYGAFVEVGGMSGLLHISQISYDRIESLDAVLQPGMLVKCMIIDHDKVNGRIALSTKTLEAEPGDMLRDSAAVFAKAEETAAAYHARMEAERQTREAAARDIVLGLGDSLEDSSSSDDEFGYDPLKNVSDSLDSLLS